MRKILLFLATSILIAMLWYLFIKPHDYRVSFLVKTFPGTVNQTIKAWSKSLKDAEIIGQSSINSLEQQQIIGGHTYIYRWEMNLINDSISKVQVYITEPGNSLMNKIAIPFFETQIELDAKKNTKDFYSRINQHLENIRVKVEGVSTVKRTYCLYVAIHTTQIGKASGMMYNYPLLSSFIAENEIQTNGLPFIEVTNWDITNDSLTYNFCFPIIMTDSLPDHKLLKYKWLEHTKAIKAVYNGNYITSDRAWYALMHYAKKNGFEAIYKPIEFYHNNPNFGYNEKEWQADIYLPIK